MARLHRTLDEAKLRRAVRDRRRDLRGVADGQPDLDLRIGFLEGNQVARQPVAGDGLAGLHRQRSALEAAELAERQFGRLDARQHRAGLLQEHLPRLGQFDAPPYPPEELGLMARLQRRDGVARGRLREVQGTRGLRDMLALGDRNEDPQLVQGHIKSDLAGSLSAPVPEMPRALSGTAASAGICNDPG